MIVDRSKWGRLEVTGGDRVRFLQGLTTINVEALGDGQHAWGAILNPKGRVLAVIDLAHQGERLVIACQQDLAEKVRGILERYAVMDDVQFTEAPGPAHQRWEDAATAWTTPIAPDAIDGMVAETCPDAERVRIHAGFLRYGVDVDEDHFPFETPLVGFLDYEKGCYVGQEPVFRVHAQGNSARTLRGLAIAGTEPVAAGAGVKHPTKDNAGVVTSAIAEGDHTIALAYLHRTCWEPGGTVLVDGRAATVHALPW